MMERVIRAVCIGLVTFAGYAAEAAPDTATVWQISRQAKKGDANAQFKLGNCYYYGHGGLPRDYYQAARWYRRAAEQGNVRAQIALGLCYFSGKGVPRNYWKGIKLLIFPNGGIDPEEKRCP